MSNRIAATLVMLVAGCWSGTPPALAPAAPAPVVAKPPSALLTMNVSSLGPITGATPANLAALRALFAKDGFAVKEVDNAGPELHVSQGDELLFYVIPNEDGSLFNVHVVSPKVAIAEHPQWKIGGPFTGDALLTECECWGEHPVCFRTGDHVAVAFQRACDGLEDARMRRVLSGVTIQRAVWSPQPFGYDSVDAQPDPCAGGVP